MIGIRCCLMRIARYVGDFLRCEGIREASVRLLVVGTKGGFRRANARRVAPQARLNVAGGKDRCLGVAVLVQEAFAVVCALLSWNT